MIAEQDEKDENESKNDVASTTRSIIVHQELDGVD
jgi:hypothetical protein